MPRNKSRRLLSVIAAAFFVALPNLSAKATEFETLSGWSEQAFLRVDTPSSYELATIDGASVLRVASENGISALVSDSVFDVYQTPIVEWRWRVDDFPSGANPRDGGTDDFALRVYIMYEYDEGTIPLGERIKFRFLKAFYEEPPPKHVLGFVWSEVPFPELYIDSTLNSRTRYIEKGTNDGFSTWRTVRIDVVETYRTIYGENPPANARISIIGDSDSTGDPTLGYLDYIRIGTR